MCATVNGQDTQGQQSRIDRELTIETVARVAYLSSDVVISVQPQLAIDSEFSKHLQTFSQNKASGLATAGVPEVGLADRHL